MDWNNFQFFKRRKKSVFNRFVTHLKRGLHLSIIPPPLTTKRWPLDHFWSLCFPPVSLLQEVGWGSLQSSRTVVKALCSFSIKPVFPVIKGQNFHQSVFSMIKKVRIAKCTTDMEHLSKPCQLCFYAHFCARKYC